MKMIEQVAGAFDSAELIGKGYQAACPLCAKRTLSVWKADDGSIGVNCKSKTCGRAKVLAAVGLDWKDLTPRLVAGAKTNDGQWIFSKENARRIAQAFVEDHGHDGVSTILYDGRDTYRWRDGGWCVSLRDEFDCEIDNWLSEAVDVTSGKPFPCNTRTIKATREAIERLSRQGDISPPCWLDGRDDTYAYAQGPSTLARLQSKGPMKVIEPTPAFFTRTPLGFDPDPNADAPRFMQFVEEMFGDDAEQIALLQEVLGYLVFGGTDMQTFFVLHGKPASGKSTLMEVVMALVGERNYAALRSDAFSKDFGAEELPGKRVGVVSDSRASGLALTDTEALLSITGEDSIAVNIKYMRHETVRLIARIVFVTNVFPQFRDTTGAVLRRLVQLEFRHSIKGREDRGLKKKLLTELPGIGNWAYAGWQRLGLRECFTEPKSTASVVERVTRHMNPLGTFINQTCQLGTDLRVPKDTLLNEYNTSRNEAGLADVDASMLSRELTTQYPSVRNSKPRVAGKQIPHYVGINLVAEPGEQGHS